MKLRLYGSSAHTVQMDKVEILFSYETAVGVFIEGVGYVVTEKSHSKTTSGHISNWSGQKWKDMQKKIPQEMFDDLLVVNPEALEQIKRHLKP